MPQRLLLCTDLDRTLIPNGPQAESDGARERFYRFAERPELTLAYVSGRDRALIEAAIGQYRLPMPDYVLGDVGTTIYHPDRAGNWQRQRAWETQIAEDWNGLGHAQLARALAHLEELQLQEQARQNDFKLSYYVPVQADTDVLSARIEASAAALGARLRLVWSLDEEAGIGLLDILPRGASKHHAIEALMRHLDFNDRDTVFCGDSGNDLEVLASAVPAVLVANSPPEVQALATQQAGQAGHADRLYIARGNFLGMNGNYSAGILEGVAHYHADTLDWMGFASGKAAT